jgi:carbon-monoxide dehydrogenase iron sulfur subunit
MDKILLADWKRCTGCRTCTFVCSFYHYCVFSPSISRIHIVKQEEKGVNIPVICEHCMNPSCVAACPEGALEVDARGMVNYIEDACTLCKACVEACPYDALALGSLKGKQVLLKCDLCGGEPQCVEYCTPEALKWVERTHEEEEQKQTLAEQRMKKLKEAF